MSNRLRKLGALMFVALVSASSFAQTSTEVDIDAAQPAVLGLLGVGAAVVAGRTIYRMTRKGAGEASV